MHSPLTIAYSVLWPLKLLHIITCILQQTYNILNTHLGAGEFQWVGMQEFTPDQNKNREQLAFVPDAYMPKKQEYLKSG